MKDDSHATPRLDSNPEDHVCESHCITARTVIVVALALFFVSLMFG